MDPRSLSLAARLCACALMTTLVLLPSRATCLAQEPHAQPTSRAQPANPDGIPAFGVLPGALPALPRDASDVLRPIWRGSEPAGRRSTATYDQSGGDDAIITTHTDMSSFDGPSMDIADNGDIYVGIAVDVDPGAAIDQEVRIYWSQDDGTTWSLFGTLTDAAAGVQYSNPSVHVGEGTQNRLYVAYRYNTGAATTIRVAYKPLASPASAWTERTALSSAGVAFGSPSLHSSEASEAGYKLFLVAQGNDGAGTDIWFSRSTDFDATWAAGYRIATLTTADRHYVLPKIHYGRSGVVHCAYEFNPDVATGLDVAVRTIRALNFAAVAGDWQAAVFLTSNANGEKELFPDVTPSPVNDNVIITYVRTTSTGLVLDGHAWRSADAGVTWPLGNDLVLPTSQPTAVVTTPAGDFVMGGQHPSTDDFCVLKALTATPDSWSAPSTMVDRSYFDGLGNSSADMVATSPTQGDRSAIVWQRFNTSVGGGDTLFFDAEWLRDPGWPTFAPGFPVALASNVISPPAICELDGDDHREIVFGDAAGNVQVYNHDGTVVPGWPKNVGGIPYNAPIAVGDIDNDGRNEVVVGTNGGRIYAYRANGTTMPGFPYVTGTGTNAYVSLGRFGPDRRLDIVVAYDTKVLKLRSDGAIDPAIVLSYTNPLAGPVAIGDVDGDGDNEYVILQDSFMDVNTPEAAVQAFRFLVGKTFGGPAALADLNLDGKLEIIAATLQGDVYVMNPDGSDLAGWPSVVSTGTQLNSPIAANIRGSMEPEVFWSEVNSLNPEVHAFFRSGVELTGYPRATGAGWLLHGSPITDYLVGSPDVFIGSRDTYGHCWDNFGATNAGWPKSLLGGRCEMSPASGDVNEDGLLDLVFCTTEVPQLCVIETHTTYNRSLSGGKAWWSMYGYNPERQFCLGCEPQDAVTGVGKGGVARLSLAAWPNPGARLSFSFELPEAGATRLEILDIAGRRVRTLVKAELPAGHHDVVWDGRLDGGERAAGGVYYSRLSAFVGGAMRDAVRRVTLLP